MSLFWIEKGATSTLHKLNVQGKQINCLKLKNREREKYMISLNGFILRFQSKKQKGSRESCMLPFN